MRHRTVERIHKHHFSNVLAMYELNGIRMVRNDRTILSIDHLEIPTHELTLILGHNGSGKSTLASIISGLVKPDAGTTKLEGCDLFTLSERERAQRAAFLPQKLPASEGLTCRELVRLGRSRGWVTLADINDYLPESALRTSENLQEVTEQLGRLGIQVFEAPPNFSLIAINKA